MYSKIATNAREVAQACERGQCIVGTYVKVASNARKVAHAGERGQ